MFRWVVRLIAVTLIFAFVASCHRSHRYAPNVELTRVHVLRKDDQGNPISMDVEFSYFDCPGQQIEVVRGGKDFGICMANHKVGDRVSIVVEHRWDAEGFYRWDVHEVAGCKRPPDPNDDASFSMVRECADWRVNGAAVGFRCAMIPEDQLLKKCPWFGRR